MGITLGKHATDGDDQSDKSHGEGITHLSRNGVPTVARRQVSAIDGIGLQIGV